MKNQPNRNYTSDDVVQTPRHMASRIVRHYNPQGTILEPCKGEGNFLEYMPGAEWCEITEGKRLHAMAETCGLDYYQSAMEPNTSIPSTQHGHSNQHRIFNDD